MDRALGSTDVLRMVDAYENSYLFMDWIASFEKRKEQLLDGKERSLEVINSWLIDNVPSDRITRVYSRMPVNTSITVDRTEDSVMILRMYHVCDDSVNRALSSIRKSSPDVLIIDLRSASGDDFRAAMRMSAALAGGEMCRQKYRGHECSISSKGAEFRPYKVFLFTNRDTRGCAEILASCIFGKMRNCVAIGVEPPACGVGMELISGFHADPDYVFRYAAYKWEVPNAVGSGSTMKIVGFDSANINDYLELAYGMLRSEGWMT